MIRFHEVTKDYGHVQALREVSFAVEPGGITGLLGPNGAGKTTAMRIMTGFLAPTRGAVYLDGELFTPDSVHARRRIGYLPESTPLYTDMLAWDYLAYEARIHGLDSDERVMRAVQQVGLDSHAHKPIRELSRGFRQRVGLARALLHDPEVLILDEPTSGLDPNQILEVRALIRATAATRTIILSTHIMQEVEALCDRVIVVHHGRLRYEGPIGDFARFPGEESVEGIQNLRILAGDIEFPRLRELLAAVPGFRDLQMLEESRDASTGGTLLSVRLTVQDSADARPRVFHIAAGTAGDRRGAESGFILYELHRERSSLEDVFHDLTREVVHE